MRYKIITFYFVNILNSYVLRFCTFVDKKHLPPPAPSPEGEGEQRVGSRYFNQ